MKLGVAVPDPLRVTGGPPVWVQLYVSVSPSGSEEPVPSRLTGAPEATDWSDPASAFGAWLPAASVHVLAAVSVTSPGSQASFPLLSRQALIVSPPALVPV